MRQPRHQMAAGTGSYSIFVVQGPRYLTRLVFQSEVPAKRALKLSDVCLPHDACK